MQLRKTSLSGSTNSVSNLGIPTLEERVERTSRFRRFGRNAVFATAVTLGLTTPHVNSNYSLAEESSKKCQAWDDIFGLFDRENLKYLTDTYKKTGKDGTASFKRGDKIFTVKAADKDNKSLENINVLILVNAKKADAGLYFLYSNFIYGFSQYLPSFGLAIPNSTETVIMDKGDNLSNSMAKSIEEIALNQKQTPNIVIDKKMEVFGVIKPYSSVANKTPEQFLSDSKLLERYFIPASGASLADLSDAINIYFKTYLKEKGGDKIQNVITKNLTSEESIKKVAETKLPVQKPSISYDKWINQDSTLSKAAAERILGSVTKAIEIIGWIGIILDVGNVWDGLSWADYYKGLGYPSDAKFNIYKIKSSPLNQNISIEKFVSLACFLDISSFVDSVKKNIPFTKDLADILGGISIGIEDPVFLVLPENAPPFGWKAQYATIKGKVNYCVNPDSKKCKTWVEDKKEPGKPSKQSLPVSIELIDPKGFYKQVATYTKPFTFIAGTSANYTPNYQLNLKGGLVLAAASSPFKVEKDKNYQLDFYTNNFCASTNYKTYCDKKDKNKKAVACELIPGYSLCGDLSGKYSCSVTGVTGIPQAKSEVIEFLKQDSKPQFSLSLSGESYVFSDDSAGGLAFDFDKLDDSTLSKTLSAEGQKITTTLKFGDDDKIQMKTTYKSTTKAYLGETGSTNFTITYSCDAK